MCVSIVRILYFLGLGLLLLSVGLGIGLGVGLVTIRVSFMVWGRVSGRVSYK